MKYKTFKKVSAAVKTDIYLINDSNEIEEVVTIDYLAKNDYELDDNRRGYSSHATVPDYVMDAEIELVDGNSATGGLYIIAHKAH